MIKVNFKTIVLALSLSLVALFYSSCKSKKPVVKPQEEIVEVAPPAKPAEPVKEVDTDGDGVPDSIDECPEVKGDASNNGCPKEEMKVYDYKNIQFEFNSSVLKTSSYAVLETIAQQIKTSGKTKFLVNGHSSAEGTEQRNMALSVDRANAVKAYLVNNGVASSRLITKGYGEAQPVADNATESGRVLNRRVEITPEK
ncbi:OmpA family protein [Pedobacter arcticus]|uniref:OmpA family protein n=1 Tax=Pedobacter arcticus TaxID=752140 RepID=UPI0002F21825|nr:OmpA family protein [Pedobacter arcticus]